MATLSFSCPKCDKLYDKVKTKMIGQKVKCQCGFVFRLGERKDKKEGVEEHFRKRKKARRKQKNRPSHSNSPGNPPEHFFGPPQDPVDFFRPPDDALSDLDSVDSLSGAASEDDLAPIDKFEDLDDVLEPLQNANSPQEIEELIAPIGPPWAEPALETTNQSDDEFAAFDALPDAPVVGRSFRSRTEKPKKAPSQSKPQPIFDDGFNAKGPVWSIVWSGLGGFMSFGLLILLVITGARLLWLSTYLDFGRGMLSIHGILVSIIGFFFLILTGALVVFGVVSYLEIARKKYISWHAFALGITGAVTCASIIISGFLVYVVFQGSPESELAELMEILADDFDKPEIPDTGLSILNLLGYLIIPAISSVIGFVRSNLDEMEYLDSE